MGKDLVEYANFGGRGLDFRLGHAVGASMGLSNSSGLADATDLDGFVVAILDAGDKPVVWSEPNRGWIGVVGFLITHELVSRVLATTYLSL